jgi:signal transduction histidine kinase
LFNGIDTLKRHGTDAGVRVATIDLIERGLKGIRDVVRAALVSYRAQQDDRHLNPHDIEDLKLLITPEARRREAFLRWRNELSGQVPLPANAVRQIILNLVLNACQATPPDGWAAVSVWEAPGALVLQVEDTGPGMPSAALAMLTGSTDGAAPIGKGTGLGLWMTNRLIRELHGQVSVERRPAGTTLVTVSLPTRQEAELSDVA